MSTPKGFYVNDLMFFVLLDTASLDEMLIIVS
ncbi:hypothetical protein SAMN05216302_1007100 [Nitrosomonas aestuarii]|uniref:Uncharacterized protein n=1 Tax=Nitrosomonas aestuarii TaxID=52441 RepID=A0A1I3ZX01_9PROT|nr:hypothetical protein SAMN05216302_1007100 [Nitrosomonas aestuarii]